MTTESKLILCVDDDIDLLESLQLILKSTGYPVVIATGVSDGVAAYTRHKPALVFVDLMMDTIDAGLVFMKQIRKLGPTPPVFLFSSVGGEVRENVDATTLGFTGVLQKPVTPDQLLSLARAKLG